MEHWFETTLLPTLLAAAVFLLVLWPTRYSGTRVLRNWGVTEPTEPQVTEAVRYLRHRRILYVGLFLVLPPVAGLVWPDGDRAPVNILLPLLIAMLVAEAVATLRPVGGVRVASLNPRTWRDLLPRWAIVALGSLTALVVAMAGLGFAALPWAERYAEVLDVPVEPAKLWLPLGGLGLCLVFVVTLVRLAVRRPASADKVLDAALRTRTVRVGVAIGIGWLGALVTAAYQRFDSLVSVSGARVPPRPGWLTSSLVDIAGIVAFLSLVAAIVCWMWLAMPTRRSLAKTG